jgi:adenylate cyclase class 2
MNMLEVENKFPVADLVAMRERLAAAGARFETPQFQADTYFAHPSRDFARTDEALRIRCIGSEVRVTYKGPKLDRETKTRREIELSIGTGEETADAFGMLLAALGFQSVAVVRKERQSGYMDWQGVRVDIALDRVDNVGTFVELELVVDPGDAETAQAAILSLARMLDLSRPERRSYLEMLLEQTT